MSTKSGKTGTQQTQSDVVGLPEDVAAIRAEIKAFFKRKTRMGNESEATNMACTHSTITTASQYMSVKLKKS